MLITDGLSEKNCAEVPSGFAHYPVVQRHTAAELKGFFRLKGTKVIGVAFGIGLLVGALVTRK